jgi:hypothetical protein
VLSATAMLRFPPVVVLTIFRPVVVLPNQTWNVLVVAGQAKLVYAFVIADS